MRSYSHDSDVDTTFTELTLPLEDILKEAEKGPVEAFSNVHLCIDRAFPRISTEIMWEYAPECGLDRGQHFIDRAYARQYEGLIESGISRRCLKSPYLIAVFVILLVGLFLTDKQPELRLIDHPGLLLGVIVLSFGIDLKWRAQNARERMEAVRRRYVSLLCPIAQRSVLHAQGFSPLDEVSLAAMGELLNTYVGLRFAGYDIEAERLLPLYRLALNGQHLLGFDTDEEGITRAIMTTDPTEHLDDIDSDGIVVEEQSEYDQFVSFFNTGATIVNVASPDEDKRLN